jgi:hypothetical protein
MNARTTAERIASLTMLAFVGLFLVLSLDSLVRLWFARRGMESPFEAATVLSYQFAHAVITLIGALLAARVFHRAESPGAHAFGWMLVFLTLWYTKTFGFASFPGPFQSWLAERLFAAGLTRNVAVLLFAAPAWAAWLALGAALRVSVCYPRPITPADIAAPGTRDRRGLLRSVAFAGLDVGLAWRRLAAGALQYGSLRAMIVWPGALALGLAASLLPDQKIFFVALYACGAAIVITNLRAGLEVANALQRRRLLWILQSSLSALLAFCLAGVLSFAADPLASFLSFAVSGIAPLAVLSGIALGTRSGHPPQPRNALRNTATRGGMVVICALAYIAAQTAVATTGGPQLLASLLGLSVAILTGVFAWRYVRASVARLVAPAFVRPERSNA